MKKFTFILTGTIILISLLFLITKEAKAEFDAVEVGEVDCVMRILQGNDTIKIIRVQDPENPFVSIFFTIIASGKMFVMADPSNTSIAARLTGDIPINKDGKLIINKTENIDIGHIQKSIDSKLMKIARFYDSEMNTLVYLVYLLDGSLKHSLLVVPLGKPLTPNNRKVYD